MIRLNKNILNLSTIILIILTSYYCSRHSIWKGSVRVDRTDIFCKSDMPFVIGVLHLVKS